MQLVVGFWRVTQEILFVKSKEEDDRHARVSMFVVNGLRKYPDV